MTMLFVAVAFLFPRFLDPLVPVEKRGEGHIEFSPNVPTAVMETRTARTAESGVAVNDGDSPDESTGYVTKEVR